MNSLTLLNGDCLELMKTLPDKSIDLFICDLPYGCLIGFLCANKQPLRSHELIYVFAKKGANYNRIDIEGDFPNTNTKTGNSRNIYQTNNDYDVKSNEGSRCVKSVLQFANKKGKGNHPTQKPAELYKFLIERYSKEGDTVLDPTFGSGTSLFVANQLGRKAIGIEKDIDFYNKANDRIYNLV